MCALQIFIIIIIIDISASSSHTGEPRKRVHRFADLGITTSALLSLNTVTGKRPASTFTKDGARLTPDGNTSSLLFLEQPRMDHRWALKVIYLQVQQPVGLKSRYAFPISPLFVPNVIFYSTGAFCQTTSEDGQSIFVMKE